MVDGHVDNRERVRLAVEVRRRRADHDRRAGDRDLDGSFRLDAAVQKLEAVRSHASLVSSSFGDTSKHNAPTLLDRKGQLPDAARGACVIPIHGVSANLQMRPHVDIAEQPGGMTARCGRRGAVARIA